MNGRDVTVLWHIVGPLSCEYVCMTWCLGLNCARLRCLAFGAFVTFRWPMGKRGEGSGSSLSTAIEATRMISMNSTHLVVTPILHPETFVDSTTGVAINKDHHQCLVQHFSIHSASFLISIRRPGPLTLYNLLSSQKSASV